METQLTAAATVPPVVTIKNSYVNRTSDKRSAAAAVDYDHSSALRGGGTRYRKKNGNWHRK